MASFFFFLMFWLIGWWQLQLGVDESYSLFVSNSDGHSILGAATIEVGC